MDAVQQQALEGLRQLAAGYASTPLPQWDHFAKSTSLVRYQARAQIPMGFADCLVVLRGLVKVMDDANAGRTTRLREEGTMVTANVRPGWSARTSLPMANTRRAQGEWPIPPFTVHAIEQTLALRFSYRTLEELAAKHSAWGEVVSAFLWTNVAGLHEEIYALRSKDVESRVRDLFADRPSLMRRLSQRELASYLNITEPALSRILRRVRDAAEDAAPVISPIPRLP